MVAWWYYHRTLTTATAAMPNKPNIKTLGAFVPLFLAAKTHLRSPGIAVRITNGSLACSRGVKNKDVFPEASKGQTHAFDGRTGDVRPGLARSREAQRKGFTASPRTSN